MPQLTCAEVARLRKLVEMGLRDAPRWLSAVTKSPPIALRPSSGGKVREIVFPEDALRREYLKNIGGKTSLDMRSLEESHINKFVSRQLQLIQEGHSEEQAFKLTSRELPIHGLAGDWNAEAGAAGATSASSDFQKLLNSLRAKALDLKNKNMEFSIKNDGKE
eukprot:Sdes_comp10669_c0_seq1m2361